MSGPGWPAVVGAIGGGVGGLAGAAGFVVAMLAKRDSRRSAAASDRSADAAEKSAQAAAELNRMEQERREDEREQRHREFAPRVPGEIRPEIRGTSTNQSLWGSITVPGNDYRVRVAALFEAGGETELTLGPGNRVIRAGQMASFCIEPCPPGWKQPRTKEIKFQFWAPLDGEGVDVWTCPCDRPVDESTGAPGHWERTIPVVWERPKFRAIGM